MPALIFLILIPVGAATVSIALDKPHPSKPCYQLCTDIVSSTEDQYACGCLKGKPIYDEIRPKLSSK